MPDNRRHPVGFASILLEEHGINRLRITAAEDLLDAGVLAGRVRVFLHEGWHVIGGALEERQADKAPGGIVGAALLHVLEALVPEE